MYHYLGYGLKISSDIEIPELLSSNFTDADLTIRSGMVPDTLTGPVLLKKMFVTCNEREHLFKVPDIASYYSVDGKTIIIEPAIKSDMKSLRVFLLGSVMASVIYQCNRIVFHASGFIHNDKAILICGKSGAGKSSVAASFFKEGFPHFTDDVCVLDETIDGTIKATPSYPILKLWDDSYETLQLPLQSQKNRIREHLPKYATMLHDTFDATARQVSHIFVLDAESNATQPTIQQLTGLDAFEMMKKNIYRIYNVHSVEQKSKLFKIISCLMATVPVYKIQRPAGTNTFAEVFKLIEEKINSHATVR